MLRSLLVAALSLPAPLAAQSAPATAGQSAADPAVTAPASAAAPAPAVERTTCRRYATTGSILGGRRECHTRPQWARIDGASEEASRRLHDKMNDAARSNY